MAVFRPLIAQFLILCILIVLTALVLGTSPAVFLIMAAVAIGVGSVSIAFCMRALAEKDSNSEVVLMVIVMLAAGGMFLRARFGGHFGIDTILHMDIFWLALSAVMGLITLDAYRRFIARPHPFLTT